LSSSRVRWIASQFWTTEVRSTPITQPEPTHVRDAHLIAWQHGSDEDPSTAHQWRCCFRNRHLGLRRRLIGPTEPRNTCVRSWTHFAAPLMSPPPAPYQERSHRAGSQGHWPPHTPSEPGPTARQARNSGRPSLRCSTVSYLVGRPTNPTTRAACTPPPAPTRRGVALLPAQSVGLSPAFCCSCCLLLLCIGAGWVVWPRRWPGHIGQT
jgi:hypothetical protein